MNDEVSFVLKALFGVKLC